MMTKCIFCEIIKGQAAARVVFQNDRVICFLPLKPELFGHTLIVPKKHCIGIADVDKDTLSALMDTTQHLAGAYQQKIGASGFNLLNASGVDAQQSVPHFHFHLFPRFKKDGLDAWPKLPKFECNPDEMLLSLTVT
ncbi:HIT family protein [Bdellovibrionota bacterium FG-2]